MASKRRSVYRCSECGAEHPKWAGRCDSCESWNTLIEEPVASARARHRADREGPRPVRLADISSGGQPRLRSGLDELDFVLGGGIVPGSLVLIGGEPGIGKSTLLLQAAGALESAGVGTLYVSGEESPEQIGLRAERLEQDTSRVAVLAEVRVDQLTGRAREAGARVLIVDSIQTTYTEDLSGAPGNVGQVRECAARLMRFAKETDTAVFLVGHVTKEGGVAGPRTLEHIVDTVAYFEGEPHSGLRILRAVKNRFGAADEVGVFEMTGAGLRGVPNPSAVFLSGATESVPGSAVTALMEGSRPVLREIQALASRSGYGTPQRVAHGLDQKRLAVLLAVLERRAGIPFADLDVFVNVTGGVRLAEPASDLAIVAALWSSVQDRPVEGRSLFLGEVGLGGEIRPVATVDRRLSEARRLGFERAFVARGGDGSGDMQTIQITHVSELTRALGG